MATRHCCRTVPKRIAKRTPLYSTKLCWTNRRVRSVMTITDEPQIRAFSIAPAAWRYWPRSFAPFLKLVERHCQRIVGICSSRTRPICSQSLKGKIVEVLVNPRGLSVDVLNDDTGDLLRSRAGRNTYSVRLPHEAEANNNSRTEAHKGSLFFGVSSVGKTY